MEFFYSFKIFRLNSLFLFRWFFISTFHLHYFKKTFFLKFSFQNSYCLFYIIILNVYFNKFLQLIFDGSYHLKICLSIGKLPEPFFLLLFLLFSLFPLFFLPYLKLFERYLGCITLESLGLLVSNLKSSNNFFF